MTLTQCSLRFMILCCVTGSARAQDGVPTADNKEVEKVVLAATNAMKKQDWSTYGGHMDPQALAEFRVLFVPLLQAAAAKGAQEEAPLLPLFQGAKSVKEILAWDAKEFFARFMAGTLSASPLK